MINNRFDFTRRRRYGAPRCVRPKTGFTRNKIMLNSQALQVAREIDRLLCEVILLQRDYVAQICSACEEPCCKRVQYLYGEKDIIFAKVLCGNSVPRRKYRGTGCQFLSPTGCLLTPQARPFFCHRYLCSKLQDKMDRQDPKLLPMMNMKIRALEDLRVQLWKEYLN